MVIKYSYGQRFSYLICLLVLTGFTLLMNGCGGGSTSTDTGSPGSGSPTSNTTQTPAEISSLLSAMRVMASVTDADGVPLAGAAVGDNAFTGSDGVLMGDTQPSASGWYRISASGFAQEFIKPIGSIQGKTAFAVRLTPVDSLYSWTTAAAQPVTVSVGDATDPALSVEFGAGAFSSDVTLSVTLLDPLKTHTTLAALDTADVLYITHPFEIRALDNGGQDQQMAAGEVARVSIADNGAMGAAPRLFWFNPETGIWQEELSAACSRADATHVQCLVSHFSQHAGASGSPPAAAPPSDPGSAARNTEKEFREWAESGDTENGMPDSLLDALTAELIAVIAWADAHPSEEAKTLLANTIGRLQLLGYDSYLHKDGNGIVRDSSELFDAMERVMTKLADPHIKNPLCTNFEKIEHLTAQAELLGYDEIRNALMTVFLQLVETCNVIQGRVEYTFVLASDIGSPGLGPFSARPRESGASYWTEYHDLNLVIHVNDISGGGQEVLLDGGVQAETDFPLVVYRREVNDQGSCSFDTFERYSYWGEPGQVNVTVQARADNAGLQYSNEALSATSAISMQHKYFESGWEFNNSFTCVAAPDAEATATLWGNYQGQLMEQYKASQLDESNEFYSFTGGQLISLTSLWDILDKTPNVTRPGGEDSYPTRIWRGSEILFGVGNLPSVEYGHKVIMRWDIQHIDYTKGKWVTHHQ